MKSRTTVCMRLALRNFEISLESSNKLRLPLILHVYPLKLWWIKLSTIVRICNYLTAVLWEGDSRNWIPSNCQWGEGEGGGAQENYRAFKGGGDKADFVVTQSKSLSVIGIAEVMGSCMIFMYSQSVILVTELITNNFIQRFSLHVFISADPTLKSTWEQSIMDLTCDIFTEAFLGIRVDHQAMFKCVKGSWGKRGCVISQINYIVLRSTDLSFGIFYEIINSFTIT